MANTRGGSKRFCPYCRAVRVSKTCDGRVTLGDKYRRRMECLTCHQRWTTYEISAEEATGVGSAVRKKLRMRIDDEIRDACERLEVTEDALKEAVARVLAEVHPSGTTPRGEPAIQEAMESALRSLHPVAHVRYALATRCATPGDCLVVLAEHMNGNGVHHQGTKEGKAG